MKIEPYAGRADEWNEFVAAHEGGTCCHLHGWRDALAEGLGHELTLVCARRAGELRGVMPMAVVRGPLGSFLVSVPFLNYGGPIGTREAATALVAHAVDAGRERGVDLVELRCRRPTWTPARPVSAGATRDRAGPLPDGGTDGLPAGVRVTSRRVTVLLDLPEDPDELWRALRSKVRSQVRRPMKEGMSARFGADQLDAFYAVFARNMRDLGTPVLPAAFFRAIARRFADETVVGVVYHEGRPAAAGFGFRWRDELEMTWASSLRALSRLAPNMLLYWEFLRRAIESGAARFNFGRCPPGGGTHRFKLQWGGVDQPLPWLQWSRDGARGTPSPASGRFALATRVWRRLPLPVATFLGPKIARTIP